MNEDDRGTLGHFNHPDGEQGELFPYRPMFAPDVRKSAAALIARGGAQAVIIAELRESDDINSDLDRLFWAGVRRACKYLLTLRPPTG